MGVIWGKIKHSIVVSQGTQPDSLTADSNVNNDEEDSKVSNLQTCWNIFNANQGVGILAMPYAVCQGTYYNLILTVIIAMTSNYTSKQLIHCLYDNDPNSGREIRVRCSYEDIGEAFCGVLGKWIVYAAIIVEQLSYCTILLILCGTTLSTSFPEVPLSLAHWSLIAFILIIPNAFMMNLKQVSLLSLFTVIIGQAVYMSIFIYGMLLSRSWHIGEVAPIEFGKFYISVGIVVIGYSSQPYMPAIEESMRDPKQYSNIMNVTFVIVTIVKLLFGLIGYLTFKSKTKEVITNNLPHGTFKITVNLLVFVLALFSFSFPAYTVFIVIDKVIVPKGFPPFLSSIARVLNKTHRDNAKVVDITENKEDNTYYPYSPYEVLKRAGIRLILISGALIIAMFVPYFGLYMSLVGNITGMCLAYIFPCAFHLKLKRPNYFNTSLHIVIIVCAAFSAGAGMYSSSSAMINAYRLHEVID